MLFKGDPVVKEKIIKKVNSESLYNWKKKSENLKKSEKSENLEKVIDEDNKEKKV